jgi:hypothetical protein
MYHSHCAIELTPKREASIKVKNLGKQHREPREEMNFIMAI